MAQPLPRRRRTQAERRATTRARLLDATVDCLVEVGYARTTTTEIAERAGVSRGAQLHHFPTKADLVITAVEHVMQRRHQEFVDALGRHDGKGDRAAAAIDILWSIVSGPTFYAWLELAVAARTDPQISASMISVSTRFWEAAERTFRELFPAVAADSRYFEIGLKFVFAALDGLAIQKIVLAPAEQPSIDKALDALKQVARVLMPPREP